MRSRHGKAQQSLEAFRESLAIARSLIARDGENAVWQRDVVADAAAISARVLDSLKKLTEALRRLSRRPQPSPTA